MTLMTPQDAATFLSISTKHLRSLTKSGDIKYICVGNGLQRERRRYAVEDLQAFIERRRRRERLLDSKVHGGAVAKLNAVLGIDFEALRAERAKRVEAKLARGGRK